MAWRATVMEGVNDVRSEHVHADQRANRYRSTGQGTALSIPRDGYAI